MQKVKTVAGEKVRDLEEKEARVLRLTFWIALNLLEIQPGVSAWRRRKKGGKAVRTNRGMRRVHLTMLGGEEI